MRPFSSQTASRFSPSHCGHSAARSGEEKRANVKSETTNRYERRDRMKGLLSGKQFRERRTETGKSDRSPVSLGCETGSTVIFVGPRELHIQKSSSQSSLSYNVGRAKDRS